MSSCRYGLATNILSGQERFVSTPFGRCVKNYAIRPIHAKAFGNLPAADGAAEIDVGEQHVARREPARPLARRGRPDIVHTGVYLPEAVHEALREIAFRERIKIHDVIMQGIHLALRKRRKTWK
jgi:hypothetical protein